MKKITKILGLVFLLIAFTGCTLMLDEPSSEEDKTENGDGFSAPKTEETEIGRITYQFAEGTLSVDDRYRPYLMRFRIDSAYNNAEIYIAKSIPAEMLPKRGSFLTSRMTDLFEAGLCHEVDVVQDEGNYYVVKAHMASIDDMFEELEMKTDYYVAQENQEGQDSQPQMIAANGGQLQSEPKLKIVGCYKPQVKGIKRSEEEGSDDRTESLLTYGFIVNADDVQWGDILVQWGDILKEKAGKAGEKVSSVMEKLFGEQKSKIKFFGEVDASLAGQASLMYRVRTEFNKKTKYSSERITLSVECFAGVNAQNIKGGIRVPILGTESTNVFDKKLNGFKDYLQTIDGDDFLISVKKPEKWFLVGGVVPCSIYFDFNIILDIFASAEFSSFTTLGLYKNFVISDTEVVVCDGQKKTIDHKLDNNAESVDDEYPLQNMELGAALYLNGEFGVTVADILKLYLYGTLTGKASLNHDFTSAYAIDTIYDKSNFLDEKEICAKYGEKSVANLSVTGDLGANLDLDFKFWGMTVESWKLFNNVDLYNKSARIFPSYEIEKVKLVPEASTPNYFVYDVTVSHTAGTETSRNVKLYLLDSKNQSFVTQEKETKLSNNLTTYRMQVDKTMYGSYERLRWVVVADIWKTGKIYGIPSPTYLYNYETSAKIKDLKQLNVKNGVLTNSSETYAFRFDLQGHLTVNDGIKICIYIEDENGKSLVSKVYDAGVLCGNFNKKYLMYFNGKRNKKYKVIVAALYADSSLEFSDRSIAMDYIYLLSCGGAETWDYNSVFDFNSVTDYEVLE